MWKRRIYIYLDSLCLTLGFLDALFVWPFVFVGHKRCKIYPRGIEGTDGLMEGFGPYGSVKVGFVSTRPV